MVKKVIHNQQITVFILLLSAGFSSIYLSFPSKSSMNFTKSGVNKDSLVDRKPAVAGSFYPADSADLVRVLKSMRSSRSVMNSGIFPQAIIVPHAGYVYSGKIAASGYNTLDRTHPYKRVFIIGSSHRYSYDAASVFCGGNFKTPLGTARVDIETGKQLIIDNPSIFSSNIEVQEKEHAIEVQLPFLQEKFGDNLVIVPILIGTHQPSVCESIANGLKKWFTAENLFVISTDFSHYPSYEDAITTDNETCTAICSNSVHAFLEILEKHKKERIPELATSICGWTSVLTLLYLTEKEHNFRFFPIQYANSGDSPNGDKIRVVGYQSIAIYSKWVDKMATPSDFKKEITSNDSLINSDGRKQLITIARQTLEEFVTKGSVPEFPIQTLDSSLMVKSGAFVTLRINGKLRGCIGRFTSEQPVWETVQQMTIAACKNDYRFNPVKEDELKSINIEISVLSPLKKIANPDEIELGKHGIYMKKGTKTGTFLPQVANETGWDLNEFLGHCSQDKAGLGWDGWKSAELFTYEAFIIEEMK
jgi:MEMO1 family protein